jgi:hypothetical protein
MSKLTDLIEIETEASEATRDTPSRGVKHRSGTSAVYSLRLPADKIIKLQEVAASTGVPPTVLLRQWVIERLDDDPQTGLRALIHDEVRDAVAEALSAR